MTLTPRQRFRTALIADIQSKRWKVGDLLPSERVMSAEYGVSRATVREALEQLDSEGMIQRVPGVGTRLLRTSAATPGRRFAFVVPRLHRDFYSVTADAFATALRDTDYEFVVHVHEEDASLFERSIRKIEEQGLDGLAVTVPRRVNDSHLRLLESLHLPVIAMSRRIPLSIDQIVIDNVDVAARATDHLIRLGHEKIAHLGVLDYQTGLERLRGYRQALEARGIAHDPKLAVDLTRYGSLDHAAADAVTDLVDSGAQFSAIVAFNDRQAFVATRALTERGLHVPRDVAVMGIDNHPIVAQLAPWLSTVKIDWSGIGGWSAARLLARAASTSSIQPVAISCDVEVLQRETCGGNSESGRSDRLNESAG